jgi:selenide, water dikinase
VTTQLNAVGAELAGFDGVHAMTDVTGFGLLGHGLEMARGAGLTAEIELAAVPVIAGVSALLEAGVRTGASRRNWASYGEAVDLPPDLAETQRDLLTDPQTSGGLLIAVAADQAPAVLDLVRSRGFAQAAVIGRTAGGPARVRIQK